MRGMEEEYGIRPRVFSSHNPEIPREELPRLDHLNAILWKFASDAVAEGCPVEHVAQAFQAFVTLAALSLFGDPAQESFARFGASYHAGLILASYNELQSGAFDE